MESFGKRGQTGKGAVLRAGISSGSPIFKRASGAACGSIFTDLCADKQRICDYLVYCGMGLFGTNLWSVVFLQAAVTLAVDMLPVPGAQGITELVYRSAFAQIFIGGTLPVSMIVSRAASFYVPMAVGLATVLWRMARKAGKSLPETP